MSPSGGDPRSCRAGADARRRGGTVEWSEEDIVFLHWRLLQEVSQLADPATPLEEKFDTLRWVFSEREKDGLPFSFVSCLRVVLQPLSPIAYCGGSTPKKCATASAIPQGLVQRLARALPRLGTRRRRPQPRMGRSTTFQEPSVDQRANQADGSAGRPLRLMPSHFSGWSPTRRPSPFKESS
jgi:hypothetical protein